MKVGDLIYISEREGFGTTYDITRTGSVGICVNCRDNHGIHVKFVIKTGRKNNIDEWWIALEDAILIENKNVLYIISGAYKYEREIEEIRANYT